MLIHDIGVKWALLPFPGRGGPLWTMEGSRQIILPALSLGLIFIGPVARVTRSSVLEVLKLDNVRTARAKGLSAAQVIRRHGLRNALIPVVTLIGLQPWQADRHPHQFSGGQRQRVGIAWALATRPRLIVCDEPVSALDVSVQAQIVNLLADLQQQFGIGYLFISHDLAVVRHVATRAAVVYLGRIVEEARSQALFARPRHPCTLSLIKAAPRPDPGLRQEHAPVQGDIPGALSPPSGCALHSRFSMAESRCRTERPVLRRVGDSRVACHFAESIEHAVVGEAATRSEALLRRLNVLENVPATSLAS